MAGELATFSPAAEADLEAIWQYTQEQWSLKQADRYISDILLASELLAKGELQGRAVTIRAGYFKYPVGSHFIFFKRADASIVVMRILHQRMDVERRL